MVRYRPVSVAFGSARNRRFNDGERRFEWIMDLLQILNLVAAVVTIGQAIWRIVSAIARKCRKEHENRGQ